MELTSPNGNFLEPLTAQLLSLKLKMDLSIDLNPNQETYMETMK